jgi:hypothetical protein
MLPNADIVRETAIARVNGSNDSAVNRESGWSQATARYPIYREVKFTGIASGRVQRIAVVAARRRRNQSQNDASMFEHWH